MNAKYKISHDKRRGDSTNDQLLSQRAILQNSRANSRVDSRDSVTSESPHNVLSLEVRGIRQQPIPTLSSVERTFPDTLLAVQIAASCERLPKKPSRTVAVRLGRLETSTLSTALRPDSFYPSVDWKVKCCG